MRGLCWTFALLSICAAAQTAQTPLPIQDIDVPYSDEARLAGLEGRVQVTGAIDEDGTLRDVTVAQPPLGLGLDEKVLAAAKQWRFTPNTHKPLLANIPVDFLLPGKQSRWHLTRVAFDTPEGASRPVFLSVTYPLGSGLALDAGPSPIIDEARIVAAVGRQARAIISFDIDVNGFPRNFQAPDASADVWRNQAIALVRAWRFTPGMKDGKPIQIRCTLSLVWGKRDLSVADLTQAVYLQEPDEPAPGPSQFHPPAPGVARVALSAGVQAARLIQGVAPEFSSAAWQTGLGGKIYKKRSLSSDVPSLYP